MGFVTNSQLKNVEETLVNNLKTGKLIPALANNADNLTPYSEDSGTIQDAPFISQGTGTGNNSVIVTTGDTAKQLEKLGNAPIVNNQIHELFNTATNAGLTWTNNNDGTFTINGTSTGRSTWNARDYNVIAGHTYLLVGYEGINIHSSNWEIGTEGYPYRIGVSNGYKQFAFEVMEADRTFNNVTVRPAIIDLTQWFNGDANIPTDLLANPSHFSWYYNGELTYNAGSIEHGDGVKLVCTRGRNLLNPSNIVKEKVINVDGSISTNVSGCYVMFDVVPNTKVHVRDNHSSLVSIMGVYYDINGNFVSREGNAAAASRVWTIPANVCKLGITCWTNKTYLDEHITVTPYYTTEQGGEGYENDYPYENPDIIDTGSEQLGAFDKKLPSGLIERNGSSVDFATKTFSYNSQYNYFYLAVASLNLKTPATSNDKANIISNKYNLLSANGVINSSLDKVIGVTSDGYIVLRDNSLNGVVSSVTGTLEYELTDSAKTTEQGTSFRQYADINDYGIMYWLNSNDELINIPQGLKIQYPVNYKGFIDDAYMYTDGDATALAKNESITDAALQARGYYKLQDLLTAFGANGMVGGALRQQLAQAKSLDFLNTGCVNLGDLTFSWNYQAGNRVMATITGMKQGTSSVQNILCTGYKTLLSNTDGCIYADTGTAERICITDSRFTSLDVAKQLLNGVLVAYEKA